MDTAPRIDTDPRFSGGASEREGDESFESAFAALTERLDDLLPVSSVLRLDDDDVVSAVAALEAHARKVEALQLALAAEVEDRSAGRAAADSLSRARGCRDGVELLQRLTRCSARTLRQRMRIGALLRPRIAFSGEPLPLRFPTIAEALSRGRLAAESAALVARMLDQLPPSADEERIVVAERCLVEAACGRRFAPGEGEGEAVGASEPSGIGMPDDEGGAGGSDEVGFPMHVDGIRVMCRVWKQFLDPDGTLPDEEAAFLKRGFRFGAEKNGLVPVSGALTAEIAALLARLFDSINSPRTSTNADPRVGRGIARRDGDGEGDGDVEGVRDGDTGTGAGAGAGAPGVGAIASGVGRIGGVRFHPVPEGDSRYVDVAEAVGAVDGAGAAEAAEAADGADGVDAADAAAGTDALAAVAHDDRTSDQKRHDALAVFLQTVARHPNTPLLGGAPVTVLLQVAEEDLGVSAEKPAARGATASPSGGAWMHGYDGTLAPASMRAVHHAACAGATQRIARNREGRITGISTPQRVFNAHQRRAITLRDGGCVIPGCTTPATWCEIHHVTEYADGGKTRTDNGVMLCWFHHRNLEPSGWQIRMNGGLPEVQPPTWLDPARRWYRSRPPNLPPPNLPPESMLGDPAVTIPRTRQAA